MVKLSLKILRHVVAYGNRKKSLNIITFYDKNYDCTENSIRFPLQSNNNNFNMFVAKLKKNPKPVNHGIAFNTENEARHCLWFKKKCKKVYLLYLCVSAFLYLSKRTVFKHEIKRLF